MTMTAALEEAFAANPAGEVIFDTLEFSHVTFDTPARIVAGSDEDMMLPLELGGDPVEFKAIPVSVTPPGMTEDGMTPMRISVRDLSNYLVPYLRLAKTSTDPILVTYRVYTSLDLTEPGDVLSGFRLGDVTVTATEAQATVTLKEIELQAFPLATYDEQYYPVLQNNG